MSGMNHRPQESWSVKRTGGKHVTYEVTDDGFVRFSLSTAKKELIKTVICSKPHGSIRSFENLGRLRGNSMTPASRHGYSPPYLLVLLHIGKNELPCKHPRTHFSLNHAATQPPFPPSISTLVSYFLFHHTFPSSSSRNRK